MKRFFLNPDICTGCRYCEAICSLEKSAEGAVNPKLARIRVHSDARNGKDAPSVCRQCPRPACQAACPVGAISTDPETGATRVDASRCIGCLKCAEACPFHAVFTAPGLSYPLICDLCGGDPGCVKHCRALPHIGARVLNYAEPSEWKSYRRAQSGEAAQPQEPEGICVAVKAFGSLKELLGTELRLPAGATVREMLRGLSEAARGVLLQPEDPEALAPGILIFQNGNLIDHLQGLDTRLENNDEMMFMLTDLVGG